MQELKKRCVGCEGVHTWLLANQAPRRRVNVSYCASFEPFWEKYNNIGQCYTRVEQGREVETKSRA